MTKTLKSSNRHHGQTELSNMLVEKNVLNEMNKEGSIHARFQGLQENQKESNSKFRQLSNCQKLLIKLTVKASSEKAWLL